QPVSPLDILPTAGAVAGAKADADADGVNLLKHLTGEVTTAPHEALYWRFGPQKAVRRGKWKLVDWRDFETKRESGWQLYDLAKDVGEKIDLATAEPQTVADLSATWEKWNKRNRAPFWHGGQTEDPTVTDRKGKP